MSPKYHPSLKWALLLMYVGIAIMLWEGLLMVGGLISCVGAVWLLLLDDPLSERERDGW